MEKDAVANKVKIARGGKSMITLVRPLAVAKGYTFAEVMILTGRTHQIRVHLQAAGYPIIGDGKYGDGEANAVVRKRFGLTTQLLHGNRLVFREGSLVGKEIRSPLPEKFEEVHREIFGGEESER